MSKLSYLSPEAQAILEKACAYCGVEQSTCDECNGPLFPEEHKLFPEPAVKKINIASGEDVNEFCY